MTNLEIETRPQTADNMNLTVASITGKIQRFYDLSSPFYQEIYGEHIHDGYYITGQESKKEAQDNLVRLLVGKAKILRRARVLDVGSGLGGSSIWLAKNLEAVTTGITISPVQIEIARKLAREQNVNSQFLLMNAEKLDFAESFDIIWVVGALTHFQDQANFLEKATKYLNQRGRFVIFDWMPDEHVTDPWKDPDIQPVSSGMLLASLHPLNFYLEWFMKNGYRVTWAEDITDNTIKTWEDAISVIKNPAVWKLVGRSSLQDLREYASFIKSVRAMKLAMQKGQIRAGAAVAEKL